jgi:hypothetical protein
MLLWMLSAATDQWLRPQTVAGLDRAAPTRGSQICLWGFKEQTNEVPPFESDVRRAGGLTMAKEKTKSQHTNELC